MLFFMQDGFKGLHTSIYCIHTFLLICKTLMEDMTHSEYCIEKYCSSIHWRNYTCCIYYHRMYIENHRGNILGTRLFNREDRGTINKYFKDRAIKYTKTIEKISQGRNYLIYTKLERVIPLREEAI